MLDAGWGARRKGVRLSWATFVPLTQTSWRSWRISCGSAATAERTANSPTSSAAQDGLNVSDEFIGIAGDGDLSEEDKSRLEGLVSHADRDLAFAEYLINTMGMGQLLALSCWSRRWQTVDDPSDTNSLLDSRGGLLTAAMRVPGDLEPENRRVPEWADNSPQGQRYADRLDAALVSASSRSLTAH